RLDASPKEVRQFSVRDIADGRADQSYYVEEGEPEDEHKKATREQRRALRRTLRSFGPGWGLGPRYFALGGLAMVLGGLILLGLLMFGLLIWGSARLVGADQAHAQPGADVTALIVADVWTMISLAVVGYGVWLLWIWRRIMASAHEEPAQIVGVTD